MNVTVPAGRRCGTVSIPASKSCAHRRLICAALAQNKSTMYCDGVSKDIAATIACLTEMGAKIEDKGNGSFEIEPISQVNRKLGIMPLRIFPLFCGESGSTLRFLVPVVGALGLDVVFHMEGKLPKRPMTDLTEVLTAHGMVIRQEENLLYCSGTLRPGLFEIPGNISSQYISGLLFALPLLSGDSTLKVTGNVESADYIYMTEDAVGGSGIRFKREDWTYEIPGNQTYKTAPHVNIEKDWSNAAFFLCMGAISEKGITLSDMPTDSKQGDREILRILREFGAEITWNGTDLTAKKGTLHGIEVDAKAIPDLVPTIAALASCAKGETRIVNAGRLRIKESDRLETTRAMLEALGADITELPEGLVIRGKECLTGGTVQAANDHRIAMSAAVASSYCKDPVEVIGAECVQKSFPDFWKDLSELEVLK